MARALARGRAAPTARRRGRRTSRTTPSTRDVLGAVRPVTPGRDGATRTESSTVEGVLTSGCCGWGRRPDAREACIRRRWSASLSEGSFFCATATGTNSVGSTARTSGHGFATAGRRQRVHRRSRHRRNPHGAPRGRIHLATAGGADAPAGTGDEPAEHVPQPPDGETPGRGGARMKPRGSAAHTWRKHRAALHALA